MALERMLQMVDHSTRQEKRLLEMLKIYQVALELIATKSALHPHIIAGTAMRNVLPLINEMCADPWPPAEHKT